MKKYIVLLIGIVLLAAVLRFWQLGINPPSLTWDEVAWGYNAYSLGIDGKDEFGKLLPYTYVESFGDFKPPVYAYLDVLPIKIFGLNEFATRFPSALFGTLTVLVSYFLVKQLFPHSKSSTFYALITSGLLAISPWHINLSRAAFEANVASFFITNGLWLFLKWIHERKNWSLVCSAISFVLSIYTFNTARVVVPILVITLAVGFYKHLVKESKQVLVAGILGLLLLIPVIPFLLSPQANLRFREVNIFSDINIIERTNQDIQNDNQVWWSKIIHNRRLVYAVVYLNHYFDNLTPKFLFINGDGNPKFSTQDVGQLYMWELPFLMAGAFLLFKYREGYWWIIPIWLFIGIIPAATARETPHALRIETTLPTFQIFIAYGIFTLYMKLKKFKTAFVGLLLIVALGNFSYYLHGYYAHYPQEFSSEWQYGYKESIAYVKEVEKNYDRIYITKALGRPYIYYLFYTQTNPSQFRSDSEIKRDVFGFVKVERFGKYYFPEKFDLLSTGRNNVLFINTAEQIPPSAKIVKTFTLLNGQPELVAYTL